MITWSRCGCVSASMDVAVSKLQITHTCSVHFRILHRQDERLWHGFLHGGGSYHRLRPFPAPPPSDKPQGSEFRHRESRHAYYGQNGAKPEVTELKPKSSARHARRRQEFLLLMDFDMTVVVVVILDL